VKVSQDDKRNLSSHIKGQNEHKTSSIMYSLCISSDSVKYFLHKMNLICDIRILLNQA